MNDYAAAIEDGRAEVGEAAAEFLTDRCTILKPNPTPATDAYGNTSEPHQIVATNVPCDYAAMSAQEQMVAGARNVVATHKLKLPYNTDVEASYIIVVEERGQVPEMTFQVEGRLDKATDLLLTVGATFSGQRGQVS